MVLRKPSKNDEVIIGVIPNSAKVPLLEAFDNFSKEQNKLILINLMVKNGTKLK